MTDDPAQSAGRSPAVPLPGATSRESVAAAVELVMAATGGPFPQGRRRADQDWSAPDSDFATRWQIDALAESDRALLGQSLRRRSFADGLPVLGRGGRGLCSRPFCADLFEGRIPASGGRHQQPTSTTTSCCPNYSIEYDRYEDAPADHARRSRP